MTTGGLSRYFTWLKNFRRPKDLYSMTKPKDQVLAMKHEVGVLTIISEYRRPV